MIASIAIALAFVKKDVSKAELSKGEQVLDRQSTPTPLGKVISGQYTVLTYQVLRYNLYGQKSSSYSRFAVRECLEFFTFGDKKPKHGVSYSCDRS